MWYGPRDRQCSRPVCRPRRGCAPCRAAWTRSSRRRRWRSGRAPRRLARRTRARKRRRERRCVSSVNSGRRGWPVQGEGLHPPPARPLRPAMVQGLYPLAREAKSWPFEQARLLIGRILRLRLTQAERDLAATLIEAGKADEAAATFAALRKPVVFECGYGPSGPPHLGTFGEVARPAMVRQAFRALTDDAIPTRLICVSDDMDGLRRIAPNLPNQAMLHEDLGKPLTVVRDPFGEHDS